jgi:hypothetical protein
MAEFNRRRLWSVGAAIVVATFLITAIKLYRAREGEPWALVAPGPQVDAVTKMVELREKGRFDDAIELGLRSTTGHAGDDFVYQMIATTYFIRSLSDKDQSGKWAKLGGEYSEKALNFNPTDIANAFNVGANYMIVGGDLDSGGCDYYRKALAIFESLAPRLQGDHAETQGRTVRLASFRKQNEEYVSMLKLKLRRCPQTSQ